MRQTVDTNNNIKQFMLSNMVTINEQAYTWLWHLVNWKSYLVLAVKIYFVNSGTNACNPSIHSSCSDQFVITYTITEGDPLLNTHSIKHIVSYSFIKALVQVFQLSEQLRWLYQQRMILIQTDPVAHGARCSLGACGTPWRETAERGIKSGKENVFLTASNSCSIQRHHCLRSPILSTWFW